MGGVGDRPLVRLELEVELSNEDGLLLVLELDLSRSKVIGFVDDGVVSIEEPEPRMELRGQPGGWTIRWSGAWR